MNLLFIEPINSENDGFYINTARIIALIPKVDGKEGCDLMYDAGTEHPVHYRIKTIDAIRIAAKLELELINIKQYENS